jgi:hypothetical protein
VCSLKFAFYATHHYAMHMHYYATHMHIIANLHLPIGGVCSLKFVNYATHHYANSYWCYQ